MRILIALLAALSLPAMAADPKPEITRGTVKPQAVGVPHSLRTIPEACARLEGVFTGDPAQPYKFAMVRTSPACRARARFVDAAKASPSEQGGWKLNDLLRVPNATCGTQFAVVKVWRKPAGAPLPKLDGQGRSRVYLDESRKLAEANKLAAIPMFAAEMKVEGLACAN